MSNARVAVVKCQSYDTAEVDAAVARGMALLGGAEQFVQPGERIVLKPNLLLTASADKAITTHPAVFEAVARALASAGTSLTWGDSPAFQQTEMVGRRAGLVAVAERLGIPLADFSTVRTVSYPDGRLIKQFAIAEGVAAADGIVSLPKLKTHALTRMTGAVKNQFGCVPGMLKSEFHTKLPSEEHFAQMLVDLNRLLAPRLVVMDAVVAMEGNGPRNGDPRPVGVLLLSDDPVAIDAIGCRIMALDPALVHTCVWGEQWELGSMTETELLGDDLPVLDDFVVNRAPASTTRGVGSPIWRYLLAPRPTVIPELCSRCGTCVRLCPVEPKAVQFPGGDRSRHPRHDYAACIRCYCCQETCPEGAITVRIPPLGKLIKR